MALSRAIPFLVLAVACKDELVDTEDTGFEVAAVVPIDGDMDVVESVNPELRVTHFADPSTCTTDTVKLVRVIEGDESVTWEWDSEISFPDNGLKIKLEPIGVLPSGYWYMLSLRSGTWGCTDTHGEVVRPFASRFYVP